MPFSEYWQEGPAVSADIISIDDLNMAWDWMPSGSQPTISISLDHISSTAAAETNPWRIAHSDLSNHALPTEQSLNESELSAELNVRYNLDGAWQPLKKSIASAYGFHSPEDFETWTRQGRFRHRIFDDIVQNLQKSVSFSIGPGSEVIPSLVIEAVRTATPETFLRGEIFSDEEHGKALAIFKAEYVSNAGVDEGAMVGRL
jgi:hypothetical protein